MEFADKFGEITVNRHSDRCVLSRPRGCEGASNGSYIQCKEMTLLTLTVADPDDLVQLNPEFVQRANFTSQQ